MPTDAPVISATTRVFELVFAAVFAVLLLMNVVVTFKFKISKDKSSLFIICSLMLLDLIRTATFVFALMYTTYFFTHEMCLRLAHDLPTFLFDCVTISLLFLFMETFETLDQALKQQLEAAHSIDSTRES